jgi:hypothetical protein
MIKVYLAIPTPTEELLKEIDELKDECKSHLEFYIGTPDKPLDEALDNLLSSQVLVNFTDFEKLEYGVGCEASIFGSSLYTIDALELPRTPKLIISMFKNPPEEQSFIIGFTAMYGMATDSIDGVLEQLMMFHNDNWEHFIQA